MLPVKGHTPGMRISHRNQIPFYAVTGPDGKFESSLPPGDYTIAFVHEKLGGKPKKSP